MRRGLYVLGLSASLATGFVSTRAFAQKATDAEAQHSTEEPTIATEPKPVEQPTAPPAKPKKGDLSVSGYFRGGFGGSSQKGRMACFKLALPGGLFSKYRLGNECEVWSETEFRMVTYADDDGTVATMHFMPTIYIPTSYLGYPPNGVATAPDQNMLSTGATVAFPNLYLDIKIPWLNGGTVWAGTRYYKRESIYISDFFYWNPSGVGAGVEDIHFGPDVKLSYAVFAVDGDLSSTDNFVPPLRVKSEFGTRHDVQLRGIRPWAGGELQLGFQAILDFSGATDANGNPVTHGGWGATLQWVQKLLGGENRLALQYGRGGGTGFGTLARFYYPDFSLTHNLSEARFRVVDVLTIQPTESLGAQVGLVYQHDDGGIGESGLQDWYSAGTRVGWSILKHVKVLGEVGYDRVKKGNGADPQFLAKYTGALALTAGREFMTRPELRLFYTWAMWNQPAAVATVDSGRRYTDEFPDYLSGATFGLQGETWW